jgi:hypothetical protein
LAFLRDLVATNFILVNVMRQIDPVKADITRRIDRVSGLSI